MRREQCLTPDQVSDLLEDRLPADKAQVCASHLNSCALCQSLAETLSDSEELRDYLRDYSQALPQMPQWLSEFKQTLYALGETTSNSFRTNGKAAVRELPLHEQDESRERSRFGRFVLKGQLGAGGFGVVYRAYDPILRRELALKLPRIAAIADPRQRQRFLTEAQAAAGLSHPNIIPIYEVGEVEGTWYLASAYCSGANLAEWLSTHSGDGRPAPAEAAEIVAALADAVGHAHRRGILHRDIKPANVLLDPSSPPAGRTFTPRLTDFGLAKLMNSDEQVTASGLVLGTPQYMAPEQVIGRREDIGPAVDVYSLGAVLYELLTGNPPIAGENPAEVLQRLPTQEPAPPSRTLPHLPRDLEAICLKCLEKSPSRRYRSAAELAGDLERFLEGRPVQARAIGPAARAARWTKRNPSLAALAGLALVLFAGLLVSLGVHFSRVAGLNVQLDAQLSRSRQAQQETERLLYASDMQNVAQLIRSGDLAEAVELLERHRDQPGRGIEWNIYTALTQRPSRILDQRSHPIYFAAYSPDATRIVSAGASDVVRCYSAKTGQLEFEFDTNQREVNGAAFSPDGRELATTGDDGTLRVWNLENQQERLKIQAHPGKAYQVAFTPDGERLVTCGTEPTIRIWNAKSGQAKGSLSRGDLHTAAVEAISLSPDGQDLASAGCEGVSILWDLRTGMGQRLDTFPLSCTSAAFAADGTALVAGSVDGRAVVRSRMSDQWFYAEHRDGVQGVAIAPDGRALLTLDRSGVVRIWRTSLGEDRSGAQLEAVAAWHAHADRPYGMTLRPDGEQLLTFGRDGVVCVWDQPLKGLARIVNPVGGVCEDFTLLAGGRQTAVIACERKSAGAEHQLHVRDVGTGRLLETSLLPPLSGKAWSRIAAAGEDRFLVLMDADGGFYLCCRTARRVERCRLVPPPGNATGFSCSPDGALLAVTTDVHDDPVKVYALPAGTLAKELPTGRAGTVVFSPDGRKLVTNSHRELLIWDTRSWQLIRRLKDLNQTVHSIAASPDGKWLAAVDSDREIVVWNLLSGENHFTARSEEECELLFSPDSRTLLCLGSSGYLGAWNTRTGRAVGPIPAVIPADTLKMAFARDAKLVFLPHDGRLSALSY